MPNIEDVPLASLFSGPLVGAIDASIHAQREKLSLIEAAGFDDDQNLVYVSFRYETEEINPDTGESRRVTHKLSIPLLLFFDFPNLNISELTQTFAVEVRSVEETPRYTPDLQRAQLSVTRLRVKPSSRRTTFSKKTRRTFDLDITMKATLDEASTGIDLLSRKASTAVVDERGD